MLFNSFEFLFGFLPVALAGFYVFGRTSRLAAAAWLAGASVAFYAWWDVAQVGLLLASIAFNFWCGRRLTTQPDSGARRRLLTAGISANLGLLGVFKYADFVVETLNALAGTVFAVPGIELPLGISFFTFTQIAFLADSARGAAREYRPTHYLLFVTWFPHLIAGPVIHHRQLMPQFERADVYRWHPDRGVRGLALFTIGLAKKVLIADALAPLATPVFDAAAAGDAIGMAAAWTAALAYTFQLYFDFSGYSDMAVGLSALFGVTLPANFNSPYKATNIAEFWRRWHMTLSAFLREYLYVPLGGNRKGPGRRYLNLLVTMVLGGLWHGANWTFVLWGLFHGLLLAAYHACHGMWPAPLRSASPAGRAAGQLFTFAAVVAGWVLFRAEGMDAAVRIFKSMASAEAPTPATSASAVALIGVAAVVAFVLPNSMECESLVELHLASPGWRGRLARIASGPLGGAAVAALLVLCMMKLTIVSSEFLYFQF